MSRLLYAVLAALALAGAGWSATEIFGYAAPPERPSAVSGAGFRFERERQHLVHLAGSPYALGYHNARLFPELMRKQEDELLDLLFDFAGGAAGAMFLRQTSLTYLAGLDDYLLPRERDEILGLAEGGADPFPDLGPRYARIASYHAIHELSQRFAFDNPLFACSLIAVGRTDGHALLARNFDSEVGEVFDRDKLVLAVQPEAGLGFVSVAWSGMAGAVSGMNEAGLAVVLNAGASADYRRVGTPTTLLVRRALEQARTVDEAIAVLTSSPRFVADIIGLADRQGSVAVLELTPERYAVRRGDLLLATNHFESPELLNDPVSQARKQQTTTVARRARLEALVQARTTPWDAPGLVEALRDKKSADGTPLPLGHRHALDALIATHSVVFDTTAGIVWVSEGPKTLGPYHAYDVAKLIHATSPETARAAYLPDIPPDPGYDIGPSIAYARALWRMTERDLTRGDNDRAEAHLAEMPQAFALHPTTLMLEGDLAHAEGQETRAHTYWEEALAAPPEYEAERARLLRDLGR